MLKTLEDLKVEFIPMSDEGMFYCQMSGRDAPVKIAERIQAEIDETCLLCPLFEDGTPAQLGKRFCNQIGEMHAIEAITVLKNGQFEIRDENENTTFYGVGEAVKCATTQDTREKIVEDLANDLVGFEGEEFEEMILANSYFERIFALAKALNE